jgi:hypothetical protein
MPKKGETADGSGTKITKPTKTTKKTNLSFVIFVIFVIFVPPPWRVSLAAAHAHYDRSAL